MSWKALLRHRRAKWIALIAVATAIAGGIALQQGLSKPPLLPVLVSVERGDVVNNVEATGTVDAVTTVNIGCQISGMVKKLYVDFNSPVKKGQVLMTLEDSQYVAALKQAEADLAAARAAVRIAAVAIETAKADLDAARAQQAQSEALARQAALDSKRQESLFQAEISAAADRDRLRSQNESAQAAAIGSRALAAQAQSRMANAQAQLIQAQAMEKQKVANLDQARTNLSYTVIRSPIDGVVVARNIDVGQTVAARLSAPNLFNIAEDLEHMYVYTKLDVRDVSRVKVGQEASFAVDAFPKQTWEGKVVQVRINPITSLKGQSAPSQLGATTPSTIPGLQTQSSSSTAPAGASTGATASSAPSISGGGSGGGGGTGAGSSAAPGLVQYDALIEFSNPDRRLLPGMTAYVTMPVSAVYDVLRVRKEAFRASPPITMEEKKALLDRYKIGRDDQVVWIQNGSRYRPLAVKVGTTDYVFAEITGGDVKDGDRVLAGYREAEK